MKGLEIGYARVSTDEQDLATQLAALAELGVGDDRIYVDKGLTGTNRARPGLREALAACRAGAGTLTPPMAEILAAMADITRKTVDECHRRRSLGPGGQGRAGY